MITLNEAAGNIAAALNKPFDEVLKERLKFTIKLWRSRLIRQDLERNPISVEFLQTITPNLIKVDKGDNCYISVDCPVLRTEEKVPQTIRPKQDLTPYKFVGSLDRLVPYKYTHLEELPFTLENEYTNKNIRYTYINGYIYVYNNTLIKRIVIEGIWLDPAVVNKCVNNCYNDNMDFPISGDMLQMITTGIINGDYKIVVNPQEVKIEEN